MADRPPEPPPRRVPGQGDFTTVEELLRARLSAAIGGWRGALESALPTVAFVLVWNRTSDVRLSAITAVVAAVLVGAVRLLEGQTLRYVGYALVAVVIAGLFAVRSGRAQDAFLPGMLWNAGSGLLFLLTNLVRWPLFGFLIAAGDPELTETSARIRASGSRHSRALRAQLSEAERAELEARDEADADALNQALTVWRRHDGIVTVASRLGWVLVGLAVVRLAVQVPLYLQGEVEALGVAKIVLGWPAYAAAVLVAVLVVLRGHTPLDSGPAPPDPD